MIDSHVSRRCASHSPHKSSNIRAIYQELTEHGSQAFPGSGHQIAQEEEMRRIKRNLEMVKQERDIPKKSSASFSHERQ